MVPANVFHDIDRKIAYSYSSVPTKEFGDISLTDRIFKTLGRVRLYAEKILPEARLSKRDYKSQIEGIVDSFEKGTEADLSGVEGIFKPLTTLNIIQIKEGKAQINNHYDFVIRLLAEAYYNLVKYPELSELTYPSKKTVAQAELSQVESQIETGLSKMFS